jgi:hypothetical protein
MVMGMWVKVIRMMMMAAGAAFGFGPAGAA